ncbi:alpha/beta fold hydrolase [Saccharopolyspora gloriosae]|uniref:Pimeloyl-ACP methyl ester carboxylesterase n=1 Tax=Saccharopolyspora gloriosae TaxID=455344 RepID=A0A840NFP8_9PSEU|nr:alpha/beta fold hydrolase [Saccharopolyspora gloriosae]MBB5069083.1 pimeloyl-ACP methyl ester carboxylesterase [Saccharopolyspora gloriosae]
MTDSSTVDAVFVLVHGAWHSSAQWAAAQRALTARGAASVAVDLPGHGFDAPLPSGYAEPGQPGLDTEKSALAGMTMDEAAAAIVAVLRGARRHSQVVLVSHSAGGGPASLAAELAPELVDLQVYLSAFVPAGRPRFADYITAPENADALGASLYIGDSEALGAMRINPLSTDPDYVEELRRTHYSDTPAAAFTRWRHALSPDLPIAIPTTAVTVTADRWGAVPRAFVRCASDRALAPATQDLMIAEADAAMPEHPFAVSTLPGGHTPFAARPDDLAAALMSVLRRPRAAE